MLKIYRCNVCGNLIEIIDHSGVDPVCCGEDMEEMIPGTSDGAKEKHIPVWSERRNDQPTNSLEFSGHKILTVHVGEVSHPMTEAHLIQWVTVLTDKGIYRKHLLPNQKPEVEFILPEGENVDAVYSYCNLHGLWVSTK